MPRYGMVIDVTKCDGCYNCFIACKDEYCETGHTRLLGAPADDRPGLDEDHRQGTRAVPEGQAGLHRGSLHAVRESGLRERRRRWSGLQARRRHRHHRSREGRGSEGYRHQVSIPQDLLERGRERGAEMHVLRPPAGRWLERAPLCGGLPDRSPALRRPGRSRAALSPRPDEVGGADAPRVQARARRSAIVGLPKNFVAGSVVFADTDECARESPSSSQGDGRQRPRKTDGFGDFEFEGLPDDKDYKLTVSAPGYVAQEFDVKTYKSIYLGDIFLTK